MKLEIHIPQNFTQERKYTIDVLLGYFKDLNWSYQEQKVNKTTFHLNDAPILAIEDVFWNSLSEQHFNYKNLEIPKQPLKQYIECPEFSGELIGVFGNKKSYSYDGHLCLTIDVVASAFFLLTRWEEYTSDERDNWNRFPDDASFLVKNKLHQRPLVNEYIHCIKSILSYHSGSTIEYANTYKAHITHDVDEIFRLSPISKFLSALAGDILVRKSAKQFLKTLIQKVMISAGYQKDPSDTFDYLMDISEKFNLKSKFYFIPGERGEQDFRYSISDKHVRQLMQRIKYREHIIGIHPSLETNEKLEALDHEVERLKTVCGCKPDEGRNHYLTLSVPHTWRQWEKNHLKKDSTLGFRTCGGFRCGICYSFPVFDILSREKYNLQELPLTLMEVALTQKDSSPEKLEKTVQDLVDIVKKYEGEFVLLWHNNNLNHPYYQKYADKYENIVSYIVKQRA